ncbi:YybH family protein [Geodermatophilus sp. URMC 64]
MPRGVELRELHPAFEAGYNAHDLDQVLALYAPGATLARQDGTYLTGLQAIREELDAFFSVPGGRLSMSTRYVMESGDLALLSAEWTLSVGDESATCVSSEVAQRQPDGGWLWILDHPFTVMDPAAMASA